MTPSPTPRRGRPPTGGREQILAAAYELLDEKGIAKMTTRAVADRAGVSEGSIFYHFKDRTGLLRAVFEASMQPLAVFREKVPEDAGLREILDAFATAVEAFLTKGLVVMFAAQSDAELRSGMHEFMDVNNLGPQHGIRFIAAYLTEMQRAGTVRADIDPAAAASMLIANCMLQAGNTRLVGHTRGVSTRDEVLDTLVTMLAP
ncbi:TetR/AcrR family transcriptional regulator [Aldersonia sp. NBC_00410]|jgi:AcrR family transcriptional regulator|uniref:TetR/AcrR family transcriptional regulator n=1 Tax=Aldersonia sp. NBC_00410 TaxID=2975954 RepID=UPI00224D6867|nr:TetR/AcrR family transcriptional regulator [Aldersonia sp. NBC_00410]MCX5043124.1 TetR/AcrR family transcriptional regulator [Aldersonia sp. NBC_00410]